MSQDTAPLVMHPALPDTVIQAAADRRGRPHVFDTIDPAKSALVVIDLQRAFMDPGAPSEVARARTVVPNVNRLAAAMRRAGGRVVWIRATFDKAGWPNFFDYMVNPQLSGRILAALQEDADMHALCGELDVRDGDMIVNKYRLSAFLPGTSNLPILLRTAGVDTVLIAGCMTNVCCDSSARDAVMTDFKTIMIEDANATRTDEAHIAALTTFLQSFGDVRKTDEIVAMLEG
ncbi:isochorismatase family cysteine hydrolase [Mesorhizobium sp. CAU 1732]|uniref:isochorismatase family cysteine hydrolase n=1 Tax=Mesorhizobium sp. CAU 1732 TaxID=3140358 RepID=UPI003261CB6D